ncbi:MAG: SH3 domain-containing protein [Novosphingobium sp.]|nr:SH3 domain-containing protein [Novosphingobium sp.]
MPKNNEASKRRVFDWKDRSSVSNEDGYARRDGSHGQLALIGPAPKTASGNLPLRGDLAHVRLAGCHFVPHYAVPMPHRVRQPGATLHAAANTSAEEIGQLEAGAKFDVLEIAGGWCWGELGEDGLVGYVEQVALEAPAP